ncbi:MAG: TlpA family protein disulfide reductase [Bacteroidota bacterium]
MAKGVLGRGKDSSDTGSPDRRVSPARVPRHAWSRRMGREQLQAFGALTALGILLVIGLLLVLAVLRTGGGEPERLAAEEEMVPVFNTNPASNINEDAGTATVTDTVTWRPAELHPATLDYKGPDFELEDLDGRIVRLSDFDGQIVVLNLWATWCPPCRDEVPSLIRLQEEFGGRGVQVIGVSLDENGARRKVTDFAQSFGVNYPVPVDDGTVRGKYGPLSVIPTTYIFDAQRHIRFYAPGYLEYEQLEEAVRSLLND